MPIETTTGLYGETRDVVVGSAGNSFKISNAQYEKAFGCMPDSDAELWAFYDRIPEAYWFIQYLGRNMRNVTFQAATKQGAGTAPVAQRRDSDQPDPTDDGDVETDDGMFVDDIDPDVVYESRIHKRASELVALIDGDQGTAGIIQRASELIAVVGRCWAVGIVEETSSGGGYDEESGVILDEDPDMGPDREICGWEIYSCDEFKKDNTRKGRFQRLTPDNNWKEMPEGTTAFMIVDDHPNRRGQPKSAFRAARDALRQLIQLQHALRSIADSRMAMRGILFLADEFSIKCPPWWTEAGNDAGDWDWASWIHEAMLAPITNPGTSTAAVPLVVTVPHEYLKDGVHFEDFFTKWDEHLCTQIDKQLKRIAVAWDVPTALLSVDGVENMNHWNIWAVMESTDTTTWRPLSSIVGQAFTRFYLWPTLKREFPEADKSEIRSLIVEADTSEITARAQRDKEACALFEKGLLSKTDTVVESGFSPNQMPTEEEELNQWLRAVALKTTNGNLQYQILQILGIALEAPPEDDNSGGGGSLPDAGSESSRNEPPQLSASVVSVCALLEEAAFSSLSRYGNKVRQELPKGERRLTEQVHGTNIPVFLGRETLAALTPEFDLDDSRVREFAAANGIDDDMISVALVAASASVKERMFSDSIGDEPLVDIAQTIRILTE